MPLKDIWLSLVSKLKHYWRARQIAAELPEVIRMLVTCMSAGHTLKSALHEVSHSAREPLASLIKQVLTQQAAGMPLSTALHELLRRYPSEEMELLVTALSFAERSGSSLREILGRIEAIALGKKELKEKVAAITAQGRLQGWMMAALPLLLILAIRLVDPGYLQPILGTTLGRVVLIVTCITNLIGLLWIRKITRLSI